MDDTVWQGWIEFVPSSGGEPIRTARETTQPNRVDTEYWATGVSSVYLEGALRRALAKPTEVEVLPMQPAIFPGPAPSAVAPAENGTVAILDPFSVYRKGEALLRKQLGAELKDTRPVVGTLRFRCYELPPLTDCRRLFAESLGQPIDWESEGWESEDWRHGPDWQCTERALISLRPTAP